MSNIFPTFGSTGSVAKWVPAKTIRGHEFIHSSLLSRTSVSQIVEHGKMSVWVYWREQVPSCLWILWHKENYLGPVKSQHIAPVHINYVLGHPRTVLSTCNRRRLADLELGNGNSSMPKCPSAQAIPKFQKLHTKCACWQTRIYETSEVPICFPYQEESTALRHPMLPWSLTIR